MAPSTEFSASETMASRERKIKDTKDTIKSIVHSLCYRWAFDLKIPEQESPSSRENSTLEQQCVIMITGIGWKDKPALIDVAEQFENEAYAKWRGWVNKPKAERGTVPEKTRHRPCPVSDQERGQLLNCLHQRLSAAWEPIKKSKTPKRFIPENTNINDSPIPFSLTPNKGPSGHISYPKMKGSFASSSAESKRARDDTLQDATPVKKAKASNILRPKSTNVSMPPPEIAQGQETSMARASIVIESANTSFAPSEASSLFSRPAGVNSFFANTQDTIPDEEPAVPRLDTDRAFMTIQPDKHLSSDYESSSFDARVARIAEEEYLNLSFGKSGSVIASEDNPVAEELSQDLLDSTIDDDGTLLTPAERQFKLSLKNIFPAQLPHDLEGASLYVLYEISRVFLHAEVSLSEFDAPVTSRLENYNTLWSFLKNLPVLRDKPFPERCNAEVWKHALDGQASPHVPILAGTLSFTSSSSLEPLFKLRLEPLKMEKSHRLDRRFGHDRFLELCMPQITDSKAPDAVERLRKRLGDEKWRALICDWLVDTMHPLLGRRWQPFFVKPKEKKSRRRQASDDGLGSGHRLYFFAVDGFGFVNNTDLINNPDPRAGRPIMTVNRLLDRIRPTRKNLHQSYLKLFSRTALGSKTTFANYLTAVSRNSETVELEQSQIRFQPSDITWPREDPNGEVMNDGCGRMSRTLALKISRKLGLSNIPGGFQGRLGEAKGFWLVDHLDKTDEEWIEVYPSQQKWMRSTKPNGESDDRSHRVFEVLKYSTVLGSSDLNTQILPLLYEGSADEEMGVDQMKKMREALAALLRLGLARQLSEMQEAIHDPLSFKKWVRDNKSNLSERVKAGGIPYRGGLPVAMEERLNVLLDSGFEPKKLNFMIGLARDLFKNKCDELGRRMNITVGRCVYAYMVPDFWGVLEEGEVYLDFSNFTDSISGFSGAVLNNDDVLVARNPAHFLSDIQKVRAVVNQKLMGLKDVIVFSTKGNPSLASKLSGGDYDGDMAWVCFEPSIVDLFSNSSLPEVPDLVEEGLLMRDTKIYSDLVPGELVPTSVFLKSSFDFNLQPSMLGKVTTFKDKVRYTQQRSDTRECTYLSQLCFDLVDQYKQGFGFNEGLFKAFKKIVGIDTPRALSSKDPTWVPQRNSKDIVEYLMFVADEAIKNSLAEFWSGINEVPWWDEDLVVWHKMARTEANTSPSWKAVLGPLDEDIKAFNKAWAMRPRKEGSTFDTDLITFHEKYRDIKPHANNDVTRLLLNNGVVNPEVSGWEQLKASALFASYKSESVMPWYIAGKQLCHIKANTGRFGASHSVIDSMYAGSKPDPTYARLRLAGSHISTVEDNASVVNLDDLADLDDD